MTSLQGVLVVGCYLVSLVYSVDHIGINPPDVGVASPLDGLGDLSQEFKEELEPSSDLETGASEQIHTVQELFRRRRKPITSKNDTAVNILLDKIKRTKNRNYFDPKSLADVLLKRQRSVQKSRKNLFKPKPPQNSYLPKKGILFKKKEVDQEVLNQTTTKSPDASFPYTFSSFPDVNVSSSTPTPIEDTTSNSVDASTSSNLNNDSLDLTTEASNLSISTQSDLDFEPSPTMGAVDSFQPSTLDTIMKNIAPVTPTLTIVTPTSVEPIEELAIEDLEVQPSNKNLVQEPSTTYVAPPDDGDFLTTENPSEETTLLSVSENEVILEGSDVTTEFAPIEPPPKDSSPSSSYPTEEVPVSSDQEYFDLEKVITDSGGKLQETPKIRRKVSDAPNPVIQGQFLTFPPDHGYIDYKDLPEPALEEEDPFLATQGYIEIQKIPEELDSQPTTPVFPTPEEVVSTTTINIIDPTEAQTTPGDTWGSLDDQIIKAIEEVLHIDVPVDSKQLYRDSSPRFTRTNYGSSNQNRGQERNDDNNLEKHAYGFEYSVFDENSGLTHSRQESGDENGVVTGSYEVLEPDCTIRRVTYRADEVHGFDVLNIEKIPCTDQQRQTLEQTGSGNRSKAKTGSGQKIQSFQATYGGPPTKSRRKTVRKRPRKNRNQGLPSPSKRPQSRLPNSVDNGIKHNQLFGNGNQGNDQPHLKQYGVSKEFGKTFKDTDEDSAAPNSVYGVILPNEPDQNFGQAQRFQPDQTKTSNGITNKQKVQPGQGSRNKIHQGNKVSFGTSIQNFGGSQGHVLHGHEVNSIQTQDSYGNQPSQVHDIHEEAPNQGYGIPQDLPQQALASYGISDDTSDQPFLDNQHVVDGTIHNHQSSQSHPNNQQHGLNVNQQSYQKPTSSYGISQNQPFHQQHTFHGNNPSFNSSPENNPSQETPVTNYGFPQGELVTIGNSHNSGQSFQKEEPISGFGIPQNEPVSGYGPPQEEPISGYGIPQEEPVSVYGIPQEEPVSGYGIPKEEPVSGHGISQQGPNSGFEIPQEEPVSGYGVPQEEPVSGYGIPQEEPVSGYGVPQVEPVSGYDIPQEEPVSGYGVPQEEPVSGYGIPQEEPVFEYGVPQEEPVPGYGIPQEQPISGHEIQQQKPVSGYGIPREEPISEYGTPQENPPSNPGFYHSASNDQSTSSHPLNSNHGAQIGNNFPNQPHLQEPVANHGVPNQQPISSQQPEQGYGVPLETPIAVPPTDYGVPHGVPLNTQFGVFMDDQHQQQQLDSSYTPEDSTDVPPPTAYGISSDQFVDSPESPAISDASTGFFQSVENSAPAPTSYGIPDGKPLATYVPTNEDPPEDYEDIGNIPLYSFPSSDNGNSVGSFQPFDLGQANFGSSHSLSKPNPTYSTETVPQEFQHPVTLSPTQIDSNSFSGFSSGSLPSYDPPQRPPRPIKPSQRPRPQGFIPDSRPSAPRVETSGDSYDPFAFQQGLKEAKAKRKITPENMGQDIGFTDDQSLQPSNGVPVRVSPNQERIPKSLPNGIERRNMLMNIILRPGGGDKSKALPRPRVDVRSEGPNVIIVRMTFPEDDDIKGLRAFTPTSRADLEQLVNIDQIIPVKTETIRELSHDGELQDLNVVADFDYNSGTRVKKQILPSLREPPGFKPPKMEVVVSNTDSVKYVKSRPDGPQPVVIPPPPNPPRRKRRPRFHSKPKRWSFFPF